MAFIIGSYNKYDQWDREHSKYRFEVNEREYAVKEVELEWGVPKLPQRIEQEEQPKQYYVYERYEDALQFVKCVKYLNAR